MQHASHTRFFRLIYGSPVRRDSDDSFNGCVHVTSAVMALKRCLLPGAGMAAHQAGSFLLVEPFRKIHNSVYRKGILPDAFAKIRTRNSYSFSLPGWMQPPGNEFVFQHTKALNRISNINNELSTTLKGAGHDHPQRRWFLKLK